MVQEEDKVYFMPGALCQLKQEIANKPVMIVAGKVTNVFKHQGDKSNVLKGIKCFWFSTDMKLQEGIFSTKDLILID